MEERICKSFAQQGLMATLNAELALIEEGRVAIACTYTPGLGQQHGHFHAGTMTAIADSACGYAALTMMPEGSEVLSVEYKANFLRPGKAERIVAVGQVLKAGRTLTVCEATVFDEKEGTVFVKMMATMICLRPG